MLYCQTSSSLAFLPLETVDHPLSEFASVTLCSRPSAADPLPVYVILSFRSLKVGLSQGSNLNPLYYPLVISPVLRATMIILRGITVMVSTSTMAFLQVIFNCLLGIFPSYAPQTPLIQTNIKSPLLPNKLLLLLTSSSF